MRCSTQQIMSMGDRISASLNMNFLSTWAIINTNSICLKRTIWRRSSGIGLRSSRWVAAPPPVGIKGLCQTPPV